MAEVPNCNSGLILKFMLNVFAFGRLQSSLPKALESHFDPTLPPSPPDFIEIGYEKDPYDTFDDQ
jgi:hypothetical protein